MSKTGRDGSEGADVGPAGRPRTRGPVVASNSESDRPTAEPQRADVGYGRPPIEHQFQPGISGNPKGKPKGSPSLQELFAIEARKLIRMRVGEEIRMISKSEALVRRLFSQALEGDLAASRIVMSTLSNLPSDNEDGHDEDVQMDDDAMRRMLARFDHLR